RVLLDAFANLGFLEHVHGMDFTEGLKGRQRRRRESAAWKEGVALHVENNPVLLNFLVETLLELGGHFCSFKWRELNFFHCSGGKVFNASAWSSPVFSSSWTVR